MLHRTNITQSVFSIFKPKKERAFLQANPTDTQLHVDAESVSITVFEYNEAYIKEYHFDTIEECLPFFDSNKNVWVNIDGLRRTDLIAISNRYQIHPLIQEDILSVGQRPKMDTLTNMLYCLLYMLSIKKGGGQIEQEQISIVYGKNFVISFQEESNKDPFNNLREKLKLETSRLRQNGPGFLFYALLDAIVDDYFIVIDKFSEQRERLEEEIMRRSSKRNMIQLIYLRKDLMMLRRTIMPVRELINGILKNENDLLDERTIRYTKDISDHITQAVEMIESLRETMASVQDLYLNQENLKMNESMKVMAIVTCLLAPATVISGIFGMNFEHIPFLKDHYAFFVVIGVMLLLPLWMIGIFRRRGWF